MNIFELPTYGEAYIFLKFSMKMENGKWVAIKPPKHQPRMNKRDATKYYNKKFYDYWQEKHIHT